MTTEDAIRKNVIDLIKDPDGWFYDAKFLLFCAKDVVHLMTDDNAVAEVYYVENWLINDAKNGVKFGFRKHMYSCDGANGIAHDLAMFCINGLPESVVRAESSAAHAKQKAALENYHADYLNKLT